MREFQEIIELLSNIPISEISNYIDCGRMPQTLESLGLHTLNDLWYQNFNEIRSPGFQKKKAIALQQKFRNLSKENLENIIEIYTFWNTPQIIPSNYNANNPIECNLQMALFDLIGYIEECLKRIDQIRLPSDKKRVKDLYVILKGLYIDNRSRRDVANELNLAEWRIGQIINEELIRPLFNGISLNNKVFKNFSINHSLIQNVKCFLEENLFGKYQLKENCSIIFFEDVINADILKYPPLTYIVPHREKQCYTSVIKAFFSEMSSIMENKPAEELVEIINNSEIIQRDIYAKNKTYEEEFVYQLLYDEEITQISESGIILKFQYIKDFGTTQLGNIVQEKALARVIADNNGWISKSDIITTYNQRYGTNIIDANIAVTNKYGCWCSGRTSWRYGYDNNINLIEWIKEYAINKNGPFSFNEIKQKINEINYIYNSEATLRTYITQHANCAVNCKRSDKFCYREYIQNQDNPGEWRNSIQTGFLNWMANEIHLLLSQRNVDQLGCDIVSEHLSTRIEGTQYRQQTKSELKNSCYLYFNSSNDNNPFDIKYFNRGEWEICKRKNVYENTDWLTYGLKGRKYQRKIIAEAIHIIRKTPANQIYLSDLTRQLYNEIGSDIYDDSGTFSERRIRQKLIEFINKNELNHPLKLVKRNNGNLFVQLDARLINEERKYLPQNENTQINYISISQLAELDWEVLRQLLSSELLFCQNWLNDEEINLNYVDILDSFLNFIKTDNNENLRVVVPQKLYEFFIVSNPSCYDRYCIMCNLAKNFEALIDSIYRRNSQRIDRNNRSFNGIYEKIRFYQFDDFLSILDRDTYITDLQSGSYQYALKTLNQVRNTDSHGNWYIDRSANDNLSEEERNILKIKQFAALYIFTYAKYKSDI